MFMRQILKNKLLLLAALAGIFTAFVVYQYLVKVANAASTVNKYVPVIDARTDISVGEIIEPGMLEMRRMDRNNAPANATGNPSLLIGNVARNRLTRGKPILLDDIEPKNRLSHVIPKYMRAITVALDPARNVSGFLKPGDHVDAIVTFDVDGGTVSKTVVQDVELLAAGGQVLGEEQGAKETMVRSTDQMTATMALSPTDTEKLVLAESKGKISLALRRSDDSSLVATRGATEQAIFGKVQMASSKQPVDSQAMQTKPAPMPVVVQSSPTPAIQTLSRPAAAGTTKPPSTSERKVTIVRGTKVEEVTVPK
jgi:pilus assembly protein CpaB